MSDPNSLLMNGDGTVKVCHKMVLMPDGTVMPCQLEKCSAYETPCDDFARCNENQKLDRCRNPCEGYCRLLEEY